MPKNDYEIIVVDDGSTDATYKNICAYKDAHPNLIKTFQLQNNSGNASAPRNAGLDIATGEYIFFVDSDDIIDKNTLLDAYKLAHANNSDIVIPKMVKKIKNNMTFKDVDVKFFERTFIKKHGENGNIPKMCFNEIPDLIGYACIFYKRSQIEKFNLRFDRNINFAEDFLFVSNFIYMTENPIVISLLAEKNYYIYVLDLRERFQLVYKKRSLEETILLCESLLKTISFHNGWNDDKLKYSIMIAERIITKFILNTQRNNDNNHKNIGIKYLDSRTVKSFTDLVNTYVPPEIDSKLKPEAMFIIKALRDNDMESLGVIQDYLDSDENKIRALKKRLNAANAEIKDIKSSTSWRISKPVRLIGRMLKR